MKDVKRLRDKIGKLASQSAAISKSGRQILTSDDANGLAAVLSEIDETILPRHLTLLSDTGKVVLGAGNRRLMAIVRVEGDALADMAEVVGVSMTRPDVADLGRVRDLMTVAFSTSKSILVTSTPNDGDTFSFADGTTAAALASAWGVDLDGALAGDGAAGQDHVSRFLGAMASTPSAWLQLSAGKPAAEGGDATLVLRLKDFADSADLADLDMLSAPDQSRFVAIGRAPGDGDCLVFVSDEEEAALLLLPADQLDTAKQHWIAGRV